MVAAGATVALVLAGGFPVPVGMSVALLPGGLTALGIARAFGTKSRREIMEIREEAEGILDRLEMGESLPGPQSVWRHWMKDRIRGRRVDSWP
jgi:hypothetical protein